MKKIISPLVLFLTIFLFSCGDDNDPDSGTDNFDREVMLINWADHIIVPSYSNYVSSLDALVQAKDDFITNPDQPNLDEIRDAWFSAYLAWQRVSMFEIGRAEQLTLRDFTNIYPASES
jgi:predicted lipoprotein